MNLVWINQQKRRYYRAHLQEDLLGDWTLTRCWGSLDSKHGQVQKEVVKNQSAGMAILSEISKRRNNHGYS